MNNNSHSNSLEVAQAGAKERLLNFLSQMPTELNQRDDLIADSLRRENSSGKVKLQKIYALMADLGQAAIPHVACGKGCSDCCKMNVSISVIEAERIAAYSGRRMASLSRPQRHALEDFNGVPCPFLKDSACSVYEHRPFACRAHYSFADTAYWCHPDRSNAGEFSQLESGGATLAYQEVVEKSRLHGFADIRDFFPD